MAEFLPVTTPPRTPTSPPLAFSGSRLSWADLPRTVRARIGELAGAAVVTETSATSGFSPGYAAVLELGDGTRVFVKAVSPEQNPGSPDLARAEIEVARHLPAAVPAPRLLWSDDDGVWVLTGFTAVRGREPEQPWRADELAVVLRAVTDLAAAGTPAPAGLPPLHDVVVGYARGWGRIVEDGTVERATTAVGPHGDWLRAHLDELVEVVSDAAQAAVGDTLVHGDLRADNVLIDYQRPHRVWLIDWPHARSGGVPWFDLVAMLPSVAMQGGGDPEEIFRTHPNAAGADRDAVRAVLAALAGHFTHAAIQPTPQGLTNLRPFQAAQAVTALEWLRKF